MNPKVVVPGSVPMVVVPGSEHIVVVPGSVPITWFLEANYTWDYLK